MFSLPLSSASTASRPCLPLTLPCQRVGWGCMRSWEGTQLRQLTPTDPRDVPYRVTSCSVIKTGWGRKFAGTAVAQGLAGHWLAGGEQLRLIRMFSSLVFLGVFFVFFPSPSFHIKLYQPMSFHTPPSHCRHRSKQQLYVLGCLLGLNHSIHSVAHVISFLYVFHFQHCAFSPASFSTWGDLLLALSFHSCDHLSNFPYILLQRLSVWVAFQPL